MGEGKISPAKPEPKSVFVKLVQNGAKAKIADSEKVKWNVLPHVLDTPKEKKEE